MPVEQTYYISGLDQNLPDGSDPAYEADDFIRLLKDVQKKAFPGFTGSVLVGGIDQGTENAYALNPSEPLPAYGASTGVLWLPSSTNTGACTMNISNLGARAVKSVSGAALAYGDIIAGCPVLMVDTGTEYRLVYATKNYIDQLAFSSALPAQSGRKILVTNGTVASWEADQTGQAGKFLKTNGNQPSWEYANVSVLGATVTDNLTLTDFVPKIWPCATTAAGKCLTAPIVTTSTALGLLAIIDNTEGGYAVGWRDSTGALVGKNCVAPGGIAHVYLQDNSTAAGKWRIEGTNLQPGSTTIDTTLSSTYSGDALASYVALDDNTSIHFAKRSSGFAAFVVDNTGKAVTTPVTVSSTSGDVPVQAFKVDATHAICFYGQNSATSKAVVLTLSGSAGAFSLAVGTPVATTDTIAAAWGGEDFKGSPKIAQLTGSLYVASYINSTNTKAIALSVSGATITIGTAANIITSNSVAGSTATYPLTASTALVIYNSGASSPYQVNAVVVSVAGTTCTIGTPAASGLSSDYGTSGPKSSCRLSATKVLVAGMPENESGPNAVAITIASTTVTWGTNIQLEATAEPILDYSDSLATRHNPHLFPLSANTALLWYAGENGISRAVVLSESSGVLTPGGILFNSFSSASSGDGLGMVAAQGTTEFLAVQQEGTSSSLSLKAIPHKISGTAVTYGSSSPRLLGTSMATSITSGGTGMAARLPGGDYVVNPGTRGYGLPVIRCSGDAASVRGTIPVPNMTPAGFPPAIVGNRVILLGSTYGTTVGPTTPQLRVVNVEIAQ
jgi:hypothetical protein